MNDDSELHGGILAMSGRFLISINCRSGDIILGNKFGLPDSLFIWRMTQEAFAEFAEVVYDARYNLEASE